MRGQTTTLTEIALETFVPCDPVKAYEGSISNRVENRIEYGRHFENEMEFKWWIGKCEREIGRDVKSGCVGKSPTTIGGGGVTRTDLDQLGPCSAWFRKPPSSPCGIDTASCPHA